MSKISWLNPLDQQGMPALKRILFNLDHVTIVESHPSNLAYSVLLLSNGAAIPVAHSPKEIEELMVGVAEDNTSE